MNAWPIRLACLGCGLLLALPPAWCCYALPCSAAPKAAPKPAPCCHQKQAPTPAPCRPQSPAHCPLCDQHTVAPPGPEKSGAGPALPSPVVAAVVEIPRAGPAAPAAAIPPDPSRPLHLLQCLWLC